MRFLLIPLLALAANGADYQLKATPGTVAWGYYWSAAKPVLRIKSGDRVEIQTMLTNSPERLAAAGVKAEDIEAELKAIYAEVKDKGPGGHILTGPIFVEGAEPGDTLEVRILSIKYSIPYATTVSGLSSGVLTAEDFPQGATKIIPLDTKRNVAKFSDRIEIPLRPFFGSMGVAPPEAAGRVSSAPPGTHAGNLDNKDLVAGTTLFIPVHAAGALFEVGDGHAGQGNGEVDITALETSLVGTFQFVVRKDLHLERAARRDADALHRDGSESGPDRGAEDGGARGHRFPGDGEAPFPRRRLHAMQRRSRFQCDASSGRDQGRARHDPQEHF